MARNYAMARGTIWCLGAIGWTVAAGAIAAPALVSVLRPDLFDLLALIGWGVAGLLAGLCTVAMAQIVRAQVDTAENTARLVDLLQAGRAQTVAGGPAEPQAAARPIVLPGGRHEPPLTRAAGASGAN